MPWLTQDALDFLAELDLNNDRDWFHANKKRYENSLKKPMQAFAADLIERMKELDPEIDMTPSQAVFRIHRDTRFSKNKAPYKTNAGLVIAGGGKHSPGRSGVYFHVEPKRMAVASGHYFLEPDQIAAVRRHIMQNNEEFERLRMEKAFVETFGEIQGEVNKILPTEFKEAAVKQPFLFNKQFFFWAEHDPSEVTREDLPEWVMGQVRAGWPLSQFLSRQLRGGQ